MNRRTGRTADERAERDDGSLMVPVHVDTPEGLVRRRSPFTS
ncbi:hypothetical protein [Microbispora sp. NPDC049125]